MGAQDTAEQAGNSARKMKRPNGPSAERNYLIFAMRNAKDVNGKPLVMDRSLAEQRRQYLDVFTQVGDGGMHVYAIDSLCRLNHRLVQCRTAASLGRGYSGLTSVVPRTPDDAWRPEL